MRRGHLARIGALAGVAALLLPAGAAWAQLNLPPEFIIPPDRGERIHDHISINAATAERLAKICERNVTERGGSITVVVLNPYGQIIHMHAMDGQSYINIQATMNKARTALLTREPSHVLTNRAFDDVQVTIRMDQFGLTVQEGGLPIIVNDQLIGAIGAGGGAARGYTEEQCAYDALVEVFGPQPPLLPRLGGGTGGIPNRNAPAAAGAAPQ